MGLPRPPGTGRNTLGFTLGSVGGQRGTGAGLSRQVLIDFITRYDRGQLEKLANDLNKLNAQALQNAQKVAQGTQRQEQLETLVNQAKTARNKLDAVGQALLKQVQATQTQIRSEAQKVTGVQAETRAQLEGQRAALAAHLKINQDQLTVLLNEKNIRGQLAANAQATAAAERQQLALDEQINAVEAERVGIVQKSYGALSGIKGLLVGAVGGIIGGAIIGAVLFEPLQGALDAVTNFTKDILDPARHAREAIKSLGEEVNSLVDDQTLTRLQAADKYIANLQPAGVRGLFQPAGLAEAGQIKSAYDLADSITKIGTALKGLGANRDSAIKSISDSLVALDEATGKVHTTLQLVTRDVVGAYGSVPVTTTESVIDFGYYLKQATGYYNDLGKTSPVDNAAAALQKAADAAAQLRTELAQTAVSDLGAAAVDALHSALDSTIEAARSNTESAIEAIRSSAESTINAIQSTADAQISGLQDRISGLKLTPSARTRGLESALSALSDSGPSARTSALADQIERLNRATERQAYLQQLANIAEQRHALVLAHRLSLQDHEINIEKYHGQDRITALDAEIARIQKRNSEQQKFNQLLDIEYQYQQGVKRTTGESITDFIQRRAQFYRGLINQTSALNAQGATDNLQKEKDRVEYEVKLRDLAEQRKQIINDRARKLFLDRLQKELQASQEADRKAVESRRKALQAQLTLSKAADQAALDAKRKALQAQITAIRAEAKREIDQVNANKDAAIKAAEAARDSTIKAAQDAYAKVIKARENLNADLKSLADSANSSQRASAISQARSMAELELFAGRVGGSSYAFGLLESQIKTLGLPPDQAAILLGNAISQRAAYLAALSRLVSQGKSFYGGQGAGGSYAKGGVFGLDNGMNFGDNMRVGEGGQELGIVLSNKVVEALHQRDGARKPLFGGDMVINTGEDPYRARGLWEQRMRQVAKETVRDELRH